MLTISWKTAVLVWRKRRQGGMTQRETDVPRSSKEKRDERQRRERGRKRKGVTETRRRKAVSSLLDSVKRLVVKLITA